MNPLSSGKMRHRVTLQRKVIDYDGSPTGAAPRPVWEDIGTYWAHVQPLSGEELVNAAQVVAKVSHRITMRVVGPITAKEQFKFKGRILTIGSVIRPNEVDDVYEILAKEGA